LDEDLNQSLPGTRSRDRYEYDKPSGQTICTTAGRPMGVMHNRDPQGKGHLNGTMTVELYKGLLEKTPESLIVSNERDKIVLVNQRTEQLFGYSREELLGRQVSILLPECSPANSSPTRRRQRDARPVPRGLRKNGSGFPVEISLGHLQTGEGTLILRIVRDVSEHQRVVKALRSSERRYQDLYDHAPDMYFTVAEDGKIRSVNLLGAQCLGYPHGELVGRPVWDIVHPEDLSRIRGQVEDIFNSRREESELEFRKVRRDGSVLWVHEQVRLIRGSGEAPAELWISCRDITERKVTEQALRSAKEEAEQANAAKTRFLAATNHDLRQPLQTLGLLVGVLKGRAQNPETVQEVIGNLGEALTVMGGLLDSLSDVEKLEAGRVTSRVAEFRLQNLFDRMKICFENQAVGKGLILRVVHSNATTRSDEVLLGRIVQNLLSNAVRYTDQGKILLGCRRRGTHLRIEVWDTGSGIPEGQHAMIFEDHYQLGNAARERRKGLGLGLGIAHRTAQLLGHRIEVRSRVGKGSMFAVEIPRVAGTPKHGVEPGREGAQPVRFEPLGISVLLIEDDQAVLQSSRLLLEVTGCRVATAMTAREAMEQLESQSPGPDLIISDYRLPEGEFGTRVIQQLRTAADRSTPAILVTGDTTPRIQRESERFNCRLLRKPVDAERLVALIHQLINPQSR
jgi:PAS domain S-box-containing protein